MLAATAVWRVVPSAWYSTGASHQWRPVLVVRDRQEPHRLRGEDRRGLRALELPAPLNRNPKRRAAAPQPCRPIPPRSGPRSGASGTTTHRYGFQPTTRSPSKAGGDGIAVLQHSGAFEMTTALPAQLDIPTPRVRHGFRVPTNDIPNTAGNDPLLLELIDTPAFQRLKEIRFLGAIDYCRIPRPNGNPGTIRYTRYEHSIGVMQLARLYCVRRGIRPPNRRLVCAAALLHDIGHPPLSHSGESVFKEKFGIDHHTVSEDIICGRVPLGRRVFSALRSHGVNVEELVAIISGKTERFDGFFHGPINFDTIEGILRTYRYIRQSPTIPCPDFVTDAAINRADEKDRDTVDIFWKYKDLVYNNIINSKDGVLSDFACKLFLRRNLARIDLDSYFGTETKLFQKIPGLRDLLTSHTFKNEVMRLIDEPVHYSARSYYIDQNGDFFDRQDDVRYRHSRSRCVLAFETPIDPVAVDAPGSLQGVLFDDDGV